MTAEKRTLTLRLDANLARELDLMARAQGVPVSAVLRTAIVNHLAALASNPTLRAQLADEAERIRRLLEAPMRHGS